jgi:hypothetical protein
MEGEISDTPQNPRSSGPSEIDAPLLSQSHDLCCTLPAMQTASDEATELTVGSSSNCRKVGGTTHLIFVAVALDLFAASTKASSSSMTAAHQHNAPILRHHQSQAQPRAKENFSRGPRRRLEHTLPHFQAAIWSLIQENTIRCFTVVETHIRLSLFINKDRVSFWGGEV